MQIHVVKPGDTLWALSQLYGISATEIINSNQIESPNRLIVGQSLVIPIWGQYHWVKSGESLYKISHLYNISLDELIRVNKINNPNQISIGLRLYIPQKTRPVVDVNAYIDTRMTGMRTGEVINKVGEKLTFLAVFSYAVNRNGTITPIADQPAINAAYNNRVVPLLVLTNFEQGTFSNELATALLTNSTLQDSVLNEAIQIMDQKGYLGLDFDFEYLGAENRERYNSFLRKAASRLKEKGYFISAALAPKLRENQVGILYEGHDYRAVGQIVDFVFFMTYEWGWSGGPPMAVSPIGQVRQVIEYASSVVPNEKIMMGIPLYGYDWTLPYVKGGNWAKSISPQRAIQIAIENGVSIQYDTVSEAPHFNYIDNLGKRHEVWFEDARSIQAKFDLVKKMNLRGFYYWVLGNEFPQNWLLIEDNFVVRKRVRG